MRYCLVLLCGLLPSLGRGGDPKAGKDDLPAGVLAQLGSDRLRTATQCTQLVFVDNERLLSNDDDGSFALRNVENGKPLAVPAALNKKAKHFAISASGNKLAFGFFPLRIVDWPEPGEEKILKTEGLDLALSGDGQRLAVVDRGKKVSI